MSTVRELMNDWGRGFLAEKFGEKYQQSGNDIDFRDDSRWVESGCETCGGWDDYQVTVADREAGKSAVFDGNMIHLINEMSRGGY